MFLSGLRYTLISLNSCTVKVSCYNFSKCINCRCIILALRCRILLCSKLEFLKVKLNEHWMTLLSLVSIINATTMKIAPRRWREDAMWLVITTVATRGRDTAVVIVSSCILLGVYGHKVYSHIHIRSWSIFFIAYVITVSLTLWSWITNLHKTRFYFKPRFSYKLYLINHNEFLKLSAINEVTQPNNLKIRQSLWTKTNLTYFIIILFI